jgi:hypothetical protein
MSAVEQGGQFRMVLANERLHLPVRACEFTIERLHDDVHAASHALVGPTGTLVFGDAHAHQLATPGDQGLQHALALVRQGFDEYAKHARALRAALFRAADSGATSRGDGA